MELGKSEKLTGLCGIVLNERGEILIGKRARDPFKGVWGLFSGIGASQMGLSGGEAINEEISTDLGVDRYIGRKVFQIEVEDDPKIKVLEVYVGRIEGDINLNPEAATEVKWTTLDKALKMDLAFDHSEILERYSSKKYEK